MKGQLQPERREIRPMRRFRQANGVSLLLGLSIVASLSLAGSDDFEPSSDQARTSTEIVQRLKETHYRRLDIDDGFSSDLFDDYLDFEDPARMLLLTSDVKVPESGPLFAVMKAIGGVYLRQNVNATTLDIICFIMSL